MQYVTSSLSNPFGLDPDREPFVPGYGDANADFHVVGDHPRIHGGVGSGVPFTEAESGQRLQRALAEGGLLQEDGTPPSVGNTYLSYLYACADTELPTAADYEALEPYFDAEMRAITAHVLLPVGERVTRHVFGTCTARRPDAVDMDALHATEVPGSGWLVYPIKEPAEWTDDDEQDLVDALQRLQASDYRREADLGRFMHGADPYLVR